MAAKEKAKKFSKADDARWRNKVPAKKEATLKKPTSKKVSRVDPKMVDALYLLGVKIDRAMIPINKLKEEYANLESQIMQELVDAGGTAVKGQKGHVFIEKMEVPTLKDWDGKTLPWIVKRKAWDLLVRKVNSKAWRDYAVRVKGGIPGVEKFTRNVLHCVKITKKVS